MHAMSQTLQITNEHHAFELPALETARLLSGFASLTTKGKTPEKSEVLFALALSREVRNPGYIGQSLYYLAMVYCAETNVRQALILLDEAKKLLAEEEKPFVLMQCLELSGSIYQQLEDTEMALTEFFAALDIVGKNLSLEYHKGSLHQKIGHVFKATRDFDTAATHFRKFLEVSEKFQRSNEIAEACFELGNILTLGDQLGEAGILLKRAQEMASLHSNKHIELFSLVTRAILKTRLRQFKDAIHLFEEAEAETGKSGNREILAHLMRSKAKLFIDMDRFADALPLLEQAKEIAEELKLNQVLLMVYKFFTSAHEGLGQFKEALDYNKLHFTLEKKILEYRCKNKVQGLQMKFQMEEILNENEIFKLKNVVLQQANDQISRQKDKIEHINSEITSSLTYASKIQCAILPRREEVAETLPDHFILWKPRDLVSGDFYWYFNAETHSYFAAVDCTGHGVPGAFMSMISNTILNELVSANKHREPSDILLQLNLEIKKALKQDLSENENHDGLDIALCRVEHATGKISFSGANRPMYLVKNGANEITEIKSDKGSIGGMHSHNDRMFNQHDMMLESCDRVYLFTDGITDQFGAQTGKKLRPVNFRQWVLESCNRPMQELESFFSEKLEQWKGGEYQTDDVLVMGFGL